jgi:hypothetical protein
MDTSGPSGKGGLSDHQLISQLAERVAEYSAAKRKKRRTKPSKA